MKRSSIVLLLVVITMLLSSCALNNPEQGEEAAFTTPPASSAATPNAATVASTTPASSPSPSKITFVYEKPDDTAYKDRLSQTLVDSFPDFDDVVAGFLVDEDYTIFTQIDLMMYAEENKDIAALSQILGLWQYHSLCEPIFLFGDMNNYILHKDIDGMVLIAHYMIGDDGKPDVVGIRNIDGKLPVNDVLRKGMVADVRIAKVLRAYWDKAVEAIGFDAKDMTPYTYQEVDIRFGFSGDIFFQAPFTDKKAVSPAYYYDVAGEKGLYVILSTDGDVWATEIESRTDLGSKSIVAVGEPIKGKIDPLDQEEIDSFIDREGLGLIPQ